jgi:magnesium transporter
VPMRRMMPREVLAGVMIGATLGVVTTPLVWWHWHDAALAFSMGLSVFAASSTATGAAMLLPAGLTSLNLDPAFGSGPIATVLQDLISIWIYLTVTSVMMTF